MVAFFSSLMRLIKPIICRLASTSSPRVGSSNSTSWGSCRNVSARLARIRCPRESSRANTVQISSKSSNSFKKPRFSAYARSSIPHTCFFQRKLVRTG